MEVAALGATSRVAQLSRRAVSNDSVWWLYYGEKEKDGDGLTARRKGGEIKNIDGDQNRERSL